MASAFEPVHLGADHAADDTALDGPSSRPGTAPREDEAGPDDCYDETMTLNSSSRSLYPDDDLDYTFEHGRRYCKDYSFPNDLLEQDRMRVVHQVYLQVFDLELTTVPLRDPALVLDVGAGTGEWAIAMGEAFPACEVVGVDISALAPTAVPHNVFFEVDDCEVSWTKPDSAPSLACHDVPMS